MNWSFQNKKCVLHVLICGCQAYMHATLVHLKQEYDYNECMYKKLASNAENSGMTKRIQTFSGFDTTDKVSIWANCILSLSVSVGLLSSLLSDSELFMKNNTILN